MIIDNPQIVTLPQVMPKTDLGILSCLPIEILQEMMEHLPILDIRMLNLTGRNIHPIVDTTIQTKTQKYLEFLTSDLLRPEQNIVSDFKKEHYDHEKIKIFSNNSKDKCQALRAAIRDLFCIGNTDSAQHSINSFEDPLTLT